jgi:hypothetical protein
MNEYWFYGAVIASIVGAAACGGIANRKHLSVGLWVAAGGGFGFLFGIVGAIITIVVAGTRKQHEACPRCRKYIPIDSMVCPNCWLQLGPQYGAYPPAPYPPAPYPPANYRPAPYPPAPGYAPAPGYQPAPYPPTAAPASYGSPAITPDPWAAPTTAGAPAADAPVEPPTSGA